MGAMTGPVLQGRADELAVLRSAVERAASGEPARVWIEGAPGTGKTLLLHAAIDAAREAGIPIQTAVGEELEQMRPFGLLARALGCTDSSADPHRQAIAALIRTREEGQRGTVTVTSDPGLQFQAVDAFADLVEQLTVSGPLLLALDDLQWADASTLLALLTILRRASGSPLALVGCFRPLSDSSPLRHSLRLEGDPQARRLRLTSLSGADTRELVAQVIGAEPGPRLLDQVAVADGNPLFVTEMLAALIQADALDDEGGTLELDAPSAPATLRTTVLRRLSLLPAATLDVLRAASILGTRFTLTDLGCVTGRSVPELSTELSEALVARVLVDGDDALLFRHDLFHETIYDDIPSSIAAGLHRDAARRLDEAGAPPGSVAAQLLQSARPGDTEAIAWVLRTAREVTRAFPDTGADLFARVLRLMAAGDPDRSEVTVEYAAALMQARRLPEAIVACRGLLERGRQDAEDAAATLRLGAALIVTGSPSEALEHLERVGEHPAAGRSQRAQAAAEAATAHMWLGDLDRSEVLARRAQELAGEEPDDPTRVSALASLSVVSALRADFPRAIEIGDVALSALSSRGEGSGDHYPLHAARGFVLLESDDFEAARSELDRGRELGEQAGVLWPLPTYHAYLGFERFLRGQWDDALPELEISVALIEDSGVSFAAGTAHTAIALIALHRDDLSRAQRALAAVEPTFVPRLARASLDRARALVAEAQGDTDAARCLLADAWSDSVAEGMRVDYPRLAPDLVRLSLDGDRRPIAEDVTAVLAESDGSSVVASRRAALERCRGLLADDPRRLGAAAEQYARAGRVFDAAVTMQQAAAASARSGDIDRARTQFAQVRAELEALHADHDLRHLDAQLRAAGMPVGRRGSRSRPASGWASLTGTERAVADLVAEGLTNPQIGARLFVSRRTVQTHVSHIFTKLDLTSRAQLAAVVAGHLRDRE